MFKKSKKKLLKEELIARLDLFQDKYCFDKDKNRYKCSDCVLNTENRYCTLNMTKYIFLGKKRK